MHVPPRWLILDSTNLDPYIHPVLLTAATAVEPWWDMRWFEWLGVVLGVVGLPLGLLGLWMTWKQAKKAVTAANAARTAIGKTQRQLMVNQLLVLVPQLRWIAAEIDVAIENENRGLTRRHFDSWRGQAGNITGMLTGNGNEDEELIREIQEAVSLASTASSALLSDNYGPLLDRCRHARDSINKVCDQLNVWVGRHSMEVQNANGEPQ